jgi:hypothetical protein
MHQILSLLKNKNYNKVDVANTVLLMTECGFLCATNNLGPVKSTLFPGDITSKWYHLPNWERKSE